MDPCLPRLDSEGLNLLSKLLLVSTTLVSWSSLPDPDSPDLVPPDPDSPDLVSLPFRPIFIDQTTRKQK